MSEEEWSEPVAVPMKTVYYEPDDISERAYVIYVCPVCGEQYARPGDHSVAGDDLATGCNHGEGATQPRLQRIRVRPVERLAGITTRIFDPDGE